MRIRGGRQPRWRATPDAARGAGQEPMPADTAIGLHTRPRVGKPMRNKKPIVLVTRRLPDPVETRMMELFDARLNPDDHTMPAAELGAAMAEADVLVPTVTDRIDAALIAGAGPRLRLIASFGAGIDHIDVAAAR